MNTFRCIIFALLCGVLSLVLADDNVRIAVLDFENNTGNTELDHYSRHFRDIIVTKLGKVAPEFPELPNFTLVERSIVDKIQNEVPRFLGTMTLYEREVPSTVMLSAFIGSNPAKSRRRSERVYCFIYYDCYFTIYFLPF